MCLMVSRSDTLFKHSPAQQFQYSFYSHLSRPRADHTDLQQVLISFLKSQIVFTKECSKIENKKVENWGKTRAKK